MIGSEIRKLRIAMGLSQQQLAFPEMTRAYISLIENGRANPSEKCLQIIARKLGRHVSYFTENNTSDLDVYSALLDAARNKLKLGIHQTCWTLANRVLKECADNQMLLQANLILAESKKAAGELEEALSFCRNSIKFLKDTKDTDLLVDTYLTLGAILFRMEDYTGARNTYETVILYTNALKTREVQRVQAKKYLATTLLKLGNVSKAVETYRMTLDEPLVKENAHEYGSLAMGLGSALHNTGDIKGAIEWTKGALEKFRDCKSDMYVLALHNLANLERDREHLIRALELYRECMPLYEMCNLPTKKASLLEDVAKLWFKRGKMSLAKNICRLGIQLLDQQDDGILRGRIYRLLGNIVQNEGEFEQAYYFYSMSYNLLRRISAHHESNESLNDMNIIVDKFEWNFSINDIFSHN